MIAFLTMGVLMVIILVFNNWYHQLKNNSQDINKKAVVLELELHKLNIKYDDLVHQKNKDLFFKEEAVTNYKLEVKQSIESINGIVKFFIDEVEDPQLVSSLSQMQNNIISVQEYHQQLLEKIIERGFKNYGIEGEMRNDIHLLEKEYSDVVDMASLMLLRRHEKDFIIRKDITYGLKLAQKVDEITDQLKSKDDKKSKEAISLLISYKKKFLQIQKLENEIGYTEKTGLINHIDKKLADLHLSNTEFKAGILEQQKKEMATIEVYYYLGWLLFIAITITGSLWMSRLFTWRLKLLSDYMNHFVSSGFNFKRDLKQFTGDDEIGQLFKNFKVLEDEVTIHFENYKKSVEKRTKEIMAQSKKIEEQNKEIENQNGLLELRNTEIIDSIKYAEKIQKSILLREDYLNLLFKEHFILFKPKDIVSGDFYWGKKIGKRIYFAIVDCTGHGVPGAFMSIIGHNLLTYALSDKKLRAPAEILNFLNEKIKAVLQQSKHGSSLKDGMDIALFCFNTESFELKFSGAQRPLIILRNEEVIELKGDRFPAGGYITLQEDIFTEKSIHLQPGDQIFAFSDGYVDQFGGTSNKKFKYRPFKDLLTTITDEPKDKQKEILLESFEIWKGKNPQVDDVCVFSAKV